MGGFCPETNYLFMGMLPFFFLLRELRRPQTLLPRAVISIPPQKTSLIPHFF